MDFTYNNKTNLFSVWCTDNETDALFETLTAFRHEHTDVYFVAYPDNRINTTCYDTLESAEESIINTPPQYRPQGTFTIYKTTLAKFLNNQKESAEEMKALSFSVGGD